MTDVFISASHRDKREVEDLVLALKARGYSVFYDRESIASGEDFRSRTRDQIEKARHVIVLWSQASVRSEFVKDEASVANDARKLISVGLHDVRPEDLPPGFRKQQLYRVDDRQLVFQALGPPSEPGKAGLPADLQTLAARFSAFKLFSWLGVIGAALTIVEHIDGLIKIARAVRFFFSKWLEIIIWFWSFLDFIDIKITAQDAILLTTMSLVALNCYLTSIEWRVKIWSRPTEFAAMWLGLGIIAVLASVGYAHKVSAVSIGLVDPLMRGMMPAVPGLALAPLAARPAATYGLLLVASILMMMVFAWPVLYAFGLKIYARSFSIRIWRILAAVTIFTVVNEVIKLVEASPFLKDWT